MCPPCFRLNAGPRIKWVRAEVMTLAKYCDFSAIFDDFHYFRLHLTDSLGDLYADRFSQHHRLDIQSAEFVAWFTAFIQVQWQTPAD